MMAAGGSGSLTLHGRGGGGMGEMGGRVCQFQNIHYRLNSENTDEFWLSELRSLFPEGVLRITNYESRITNYELRIWH